MSRWSAAAAALVLVLAAPTAGGPPFFTDDPEPLEPEHWEPYLFSATDAARAATSIDGPTLELSFGAAPDLQLHLVVPLTTAAPATGHSAHGLGNVEVGIKYRFVEEAEGQPQVGIIPMIELPTGNEGRGLGNGRLWARLPVWVQKSWGPWTTYGGGRYAVNRAPRARSFAFGGWLVQREVGSRVTLGVEAYARRGDADGGRGVSIANGGGMITLAHGFSVLFSGGRSVAGERHRVAYIGLYRTGGRPRGPSAAAGFDAARGSPRQGLADAPVGTRLGV